MKFLCIVLLLVVLTHEKAQCMKVSKWGITSDLNRLIVSVRDVFQEALTLVTDGDVYILPDFKHMYEYTLRNTTGKVAFRGYNGYITDLYAEIVNCTENNQLRRLTVSNSPDNKKEMFACGDCIVLQADKVRYLFESYFDDLEAHGDVYDDMIRYWVSFQMTIESNSSSTLDCGMNLDSLHLRLDMKDSDWKLEPKIRNLGRMNFITDQFNSGFINHFNVTIPNNIHLALSHALKFTASTHFMCDEFLSL